MAPDLVLLHGFTHTGASWDGVRATLGERYPSVAPDIRGHGSASSATPVTLEAVIADIADQAPESFGLVGYSMGGRLALHFAVAHPERVSRLILIGGSPGIQDPAEREERRRADERLADELAGSTIEAFVSRWSKTPVLSGQPGAVTAQIDADRLSNNPAGLARALRGLGTGALPSLWSALDQLTLPVSLIVGARDEKFTLIAEQMAAQIVDGEVLVVPGAGHAVHLENPDRVAAILAGI